MRKIIVLIMTIAMLSMVGNIGQSQHDGIILVRGTVVLDGEPKGGVSITVINENTGEEFRTETNNNGTYEILVPGKNNERIRVIAEYKDIETDKEFIVESSQKTYEINFDIEIPPAIHQIKKVLGLLYAFEPFTIMVYFILILIAICLILKIAHHHQGHMYKKNKNR